MMQDFETYKVDWEELPSGVKNQLKLSGSAAVDYLMTGDPDLLEDRDSILAYADTPVDEGMLSEGEQELHVIYEEVNAVKCPEVQVAEPEVIIDDYLEAEPRIFTDRVRHEQEFRDFLSANLPKSKLNEVESIYNKNEYMDFEVEL